MSQIRFLYVFLFSALLLGCGEVNVKADGGGSEGGDASSPGGEDGGASEDGGGGSSGGCSSGETCLPAAPSDWIGPLAVGDDATCPSPYPDTIDVVFRELSAPLAECTCSCNVGSVDCNLLANGVLFSPNGTCDPPPVENACLTTEAVNSCTTSATTNVPEISWGTTARLCGGASAGEACEGGSCFSDADSFGKLCIMREGNHSCPDGSAYQERTLYHSDVEDTRSCANCGCTSQNAECEITVEICSVGFFEVTLNSSGDEQCLSTSDGDGVTHLSENTTNAGTCSTIGGNATGSASPAAPVTVCCAP